VFSPWPSLKAALLAACLREVADRQLGLEMQLLDCFGGERKSTSEAKLEETEEEMEMQRWVLQYASSWCLWVWSSEKDC
jgi:hypothetical protein